MTTVYTIGHGSRGAEEFIALLNGAGVSCLQDVRAFPMSKRHEQFNREVLEKSLAAADVGYRWEGQAMGGRRRLMPGSPNIALRNDSFRAYADHMQTPEFQQALDRLIAHADETATAIMCAERLPWQCHRYLISDSLVARGVEVRHIMEGGKQQEHQLNAVARVEGNAVIYDRNTQSTLDV